MDKKNKLLYYPENLDSSYFEKLGFPGQFPYTRGIHPNLYRGKLWKRLEMPLTAESF